MDISKRNTALDITRIVAFLSVVSVHFFLNSGFYTYPMLGRRMLVMTVMRTGFMICVPLFLMLTGYLMKGKTLSLKFYGGLKKTLAVYLLASVACITYKVLFRNAALNANLAIWGVLGFNSADYAWYMEMYIGLFLLIPFLNLIYSGLDTQKKRAVLVLTLIVLTSLPSVVNIYNFDVADWWKTPYLSTEYRKILPEWWTLSYPVTYYFLGAYLRDYPLKLKQRTKFLAYLACVLLFGGFNYYRSHYGYFAWAKYNDWYGLPTLLMTLFAFAFLTGIHTGRLTSPLRKMLALLSDACLGAYLVSSIFDGLFYQRLAKVEPEVINRLNYFPQMVFAVACCSLLLSLAINLLYNGIASAGTLILVRYGEKRRISRQPILPNLETENLLLHALPVKASQKQAGAPAHLWAVKRKSDGLRIGFAGWFTAENPTAFDGYHLALIPTNPAFGDTSLEAIRQVCAYAFDSGVRTLVYAYDDGMGDFSADLMALGFTPMDALPSQKSVYRLERTIDVTPAADLTSV